MSIYYDTVTVLSTDQRAGSLKSRIYSKDLQLKSSRSHIYALIKEVAKCDSFLREVVENADILSREPKLTPLLASLLVHDQIFRGKLEAPASHPLRLAIERHKARIQSECTRARIKRRIPSIDRLKDHLVKEAGHNAAASPKWVRLNTLKEDVADSGSSNLAVWQSIPISYQTVSDGSMSQNHIGSRAFFNDAHIPHLIAFSQTSGTTFTQAYERGDLILQDKASCFPAHLLLGGEIASNVGDCMDGCAAPGNKTTHMAAILHTLASKSQVFACERDSLRSETLRRMVRKAGAEKIVTVLAKQDFLALDPSDGRFANVTHLLLDPSCSGSGITKREDIPQFDLPKDPRTKAHPEKAKPTNVVSNKKRKRDRESAMSESNKSIQDTVVTDEEEEYQSTTIDTLRLQKLSNLQSMIVEHAMSLPAAKRLTYSTCSIHTEENEGVVEKILRSRIAISRGWRVMRRDEQVEGMRLWKHRGVPASGEPGNDSGRNPNGIDISSTTHSLSDEQIEACIRCWPGDGEGTMGFFVCGFVRDPELAAANGGVSVTETYKMRNGRAGQTAILDKEEDADENVEEWDGFDDDDNNQKSMAMDETAEANVEQAPSTSSKKKRKKDKRTKSR